MSTKTHPHAETNTETDHTVGPGPSRRRVLKAAGVTLTAPTMAGLSTTTAAADNADEPDEPKGILADGIGVEGGDNTAFLNGLFASTIQFGRSEEAEKLAEDIRNEFEANTDAWISYGNWLIDEFDDVQPAGTVTVQVDILQTKRLDDDDRVETVLEAEFDENQHEYTDLSWTVDEPDDPDYTIAIRNSAALNASDDLLEYRRSYIDESGDADNHELPDEEYVSTLAGKYAPGLIFGEEEHSVLELLVGDITGE